MLTPRRTVRLLALSLAASGLSLAAPASAEPPVTVDDHVAMSEGESRPVDVLRNDSDPDGDEDLTVCRLAPRPDDAPYWVYFDEDRGVLRVGIDTDAPDEITITYFACDYESMVPGTLTISITHLKNVRVVKAARPGRIRITNPNDGRVTFYWGNFLIEQIDGVTRVDPLASKVVRVRGRRVDWYAEMRGGIEVGSGSVFRIEQPGQ
ncbi:hypothetical protein F0U44_17065 [Nocardioides humilatus]|uniref:Uncharacterized protein n=1 Tax=Nocardioides humilatus TaxID=2607660 RepID=A0A5B1LB46_9ACTN|nr:hypothetical protein [Nocardioides humilatus]KAA1416897.1 hypothetical protein F0U44_17065 [Nocardioides humilatus]